MEENKVLDEDNIKMDDLEEIIKKPEFKKEEPVYKNKNHSFKLKEEARSVKKSMIFLLLFLLLFFLLSTPLFYYFDAESLYGEYSVYLYLIDTLIALFIVYIMGGIKIVNAPFKRAKVTFDFMFFVHFVVCALFYLSIIEEFTPVSWMAGEFIEVMLLFVGIMYLASGIQEKGYETDKVKFSFKKKKKFKINIIIDIVIYLFLYAYKVSKVYFDFSKYLIPDAIRYIEIGVYSLYVFLGVSLALVFLVYYEKSKKYILSE